LQEEKKVFGLVVEPSGYKF